MAEYNKLTKPKNYDPNENAAFLYQKAFEAFVEMPESLREKKNYAPADLTDKELAILRNWLELNNNCFQYLEKAVQKAYYWIERQAEGNNLIELGRPELSTMRKLAYAVAWQAELKAFDGQVESSFNDLIKVCKMGRHLINRKTLVEQLIGLSIRGISNDSFFKILDRLETKSDILAFFKHQFEGQYEFKINYPECEKLYLLDSIQRVFTDDENGNGRLIPRELVTMTKDWKDLNGLSLAISYSKAFLAAINHPDRKETMDTGEKNYNHLKNLYKQTPWMLHERGTTYKEQETRMIKKNFFLNYGKIIPSIIELYYKLNVKADALLTTLSLLRYQSDKGIFPEKLDKLILNGYLKELPMDPYSDKPLVYKRTEDNFTLYSVGANFKDDGGVHSGDWEKDYVFWPVQPSQ